MRDSSPVAWKECGIIALPHVFAHHGASSLAPGNTVTALSKAMEVGAHWFEFDVDIIAGGTLIVTHGSRLDCTTNSKGGYYTRSLSDIRRLDTGAWFSGTYHSEKIPETVDATSFGSRQHTGMDLKIKPRRDRTQLRERLIEALAVAVDSAHDKDRFIVPSFDHESLAVFHEARPWISFGWLLDSEKQSVLGWQGGASALGCPAVYPDAKGLARGEVQKIHDCSFDCNVWIVNDLKQAKELAFWDVTGVFTDYPQLFPAEALVL